MTKRILFFFLIIFLHTLQGYSNQPIYSRIKIHASADVYEIGLLGLPVDNMDYRPGEYFIGEYSEYELEKLDKAGVDYQVLIPDMTAYYQERNRNVDKGLIEARMRQHDSSKTYQTPENFSLGSMGGFHTNAEAMEDLDLMKTLFPDLISQRQPISNTLSTHEGRPVYWVRISNNPEQTQEKPRVLYFSLSHAREPASLQQMLFQMWYLLENYGSDPEITYLIDNMEMYFVPVLNPDGYIYNQTTNPHGGGMHRKNMRVNGPGNYGVDLNRNFGYQWGYDNSGSSPTPSSNTYRGPYAFSEPETQMLKEFSETYNFKLALDNHTYSDLLIYPWGYENLLTPDAEVFSEFAKLLTRENNYTYGTVWETLSYLANGGSTDWFYGEQQTKDKVFAFTPEAGSPSDGFWPAIHRIEDICAGHTQMNLYLARLALPYAELASRSSKNVKSLDFYYPFEIISYGLDSAATFTVSVNPLSPLISDVGQPVVFENMSLLESRADSIRFELHPSTYEGLIFDFEVIIDNGMFAWRDTVFRAFGWPNYLVYDEFENDSEWNSTTWGLTSSHYVSAPNSMTDSPGSNYPNNYDAVITHNQTIDLTGYSMAYVSFQARWNIELNYDYAQFRVSEDEGQTWVALSGNYTRPGSSWQDQGNPLYHGVQSDWVEEQISLEDYLGKQIMVGFRLVSDHTVNREGFYFDNFGISALNSFNPVAPLITGQMPVELLMGESLEIMPEMLFVEDDFVEYPTWHTIILHEGDNYGFQDNTVIPQADFTGNLLVKVSVDNGILESEIFDFNITYLSAVSSGLPLAKSANIYYNNNNRILNVDPGDQLSRGQYSIIVYDIMGREITRRPFIIDNSRISLPLDLKPGIYLFDIQGENVLSGKIPAF